MRPVDVAGDGHGATHGMDVGFLVQDLLGQITQLLHLIFASEPPGRRIGTGTPAEYAASGRWSDARIRDASAAKRIEE